MKTAPVEVKKSAPVEVKKTAPARSGPATPDVWQSFRNEMDGVFSRFGFPTLSRMFEALPMQRWESAATPVPAIDITEDETAYKLTGELPGMTQKDIEVALQGDLLTVRGEKKVESERDEEDVYLCERSYGTFARSFTLPADVDATAIAAGFANGVLTLTLPKQAASMPEAKTIEVKWAA